MCDLVQGRLTPELAEETRENLQIMRDRSLSQESRAAAHGDTDLESLINNIFTQMETLCININPETVFCRGLVTVLCICAV